MGKFEKLFYWAFVVTLIFSAAGLIAEWFLGYGPLRLLDILVGASLVEACLTIVFIFKKTKQHNHYAPTPELNELIRDTLITTKKAVDMGVGDECEVNVKYFTYDRQANSLRKTISNKCQIDDYSVVYVDDGLKRNLAICKAIKTGTLILEAPDDSVVRKSKSSYIPDVKGIICVPVRDKDHNIASVVLIDCNKPFEKTNLHIPTFQEMVLNLAQQLRSIVSMSIAKKTKENIKNFVASSNEA